MEITTIKLNQQFPIPQANRKKRTNKRKLDPSQLEKKAKKSKTKKKPSDTADEARKEFNQNKDERWELSVVN